MLLIRFRLELLVAGAWRGTYRAVGSCGSHIKLTFLV